MLRARANGGNPRIPVEPQKEVASMRDLGAGGWSVVTWSNWPAFQVPPEYACESASALLDAIAALAAGVAPAEPQYASAQAAAQRVIELQAHVEEQLPELFWKWARVAAAHQYASNGCWDEAAIELEFVE
jgi:hypothetical protein